jgi:hypothetical protein
VVVGWHVYLLVSQTPSATTLLARCGARRSGRACCSYVQRGVAEAGLPERRVAGLRLREVVVGDALDRR